MWQNNLPESKKILFLSPYFLVEGNMAFIWN